MARKNKTNQLWDPSPANGSRPSIGVIERGDPKDNRVGVLFGFGRVLFEPQQRDGWDDYVEAMLS